MSRVAVLTSGGDAPGMNAAIRGVVRTAIYHGLEIFGVDRGYEGLINNDFKPLSRKSVAGMIAYGGTMLKTARSEAFRTRGGFTMAVNNLKENEISALFVIGGDGSMAGAQRLSEAGMPTVVIPATIDNDMTGTDYAIGFDTALNTVLEAVNKIRDTTASHERVAIIEVMGRHAGHIALMSGLACGAEAILLPEDTMPIDELCQRLNQSYARGKLYSIIILAEGAGNGFDVAKDIGERTSFHPHVTVLGYIQRGGAPSAQDNIMGSRMGAMAVEQYRKGEMDCLIASCRGELKAIPYAQAFSEPRPINMEIYHLAGMLSI